jgi:hypothetical protein
MLPDVFPAFYRLTAIWQAASDGFPVEQKQEIVEIKKGTKKERKKIFQAHKTH